MLSVLIENKPYEIAQGWHEITMSQYVQMVNHAVDSSLNDVRMLSILTGIEYEVLGNFDLSAFHTDIVPLLDVYRKISGFEKLKKPESITVNGKELKVPYDIQGEKFACKCAVHEKINDAISKNIPAENHFAFFAAAYLHPYYYDGKYDDKNVVEFEQLLLQMPAVVIYPIANFFFWRFQKLYS